MLGVPTTGRARRLPGPADPFNLASDIGISMRSSNVFDPPSELDGQSTSRAWNGKRNDVQSCIRPRMSPWCAVGREAAGD